MGVIAVGDASAAEARWVVTLPKGSTLFQHKIRIMSMFSQILLSTDNLNTSKVYRFFNPISCKKVYVIEMLWHMLSKPFKSIIMQ